jgi:hypothetical protein
VSEKNGKTPPYIKLLWSVYDSPKFATLKPTEIAVLLLLLRKYTGYNNGAIALGVREAARRCHCSQMTACRALKTLQDASLIAETYKGHMVPEIGRPNVASRWKLTFIDETKKRNVAEVVALPRFPNDTSGCFPGDTSGGPPVLLW